MYYDDLFYGTFPVYFRIALWGDIVADKYFYACEIFRARSIKHFSDDGSFHVSEFGGCLDRVDGIKAYWGHEYQFATTASRCESAALAALAARCFALC